MVSADVVIVGAGPAGSVTAMLLARAGLDVVLLDRHPFPRPKPCGDCLSPNVSRLLDRLGLLDEVCAAGPARLRGWRIVSPGGHAFETRFDEITDDPLTGSSLAIARDRLDSVLLAGARAAGTDVRTGLRVTGPLPDGTGVEGRSIDGEPFLIRARLTVGADGLRSVIARRTGAVRRTARLRKFSLTAHLRHIVADRSLGEMHVADGLCAGLAPVTAGPDVVSNLTVVADADRFGRTAARDPRAFFRDALTRFPRLAGRVSDAVHRSYGDLELLASGPFDVPVRHTVMPGIALVGDAAGYYDPFTGQGINRAIEGAFLLASEAVPVFRRGALDPPTLRGYARRARARIRGPHTIQRMIEFVLSRPALADRMIRRLAGRPVAARALIAATGDLAPAFSVATPAVLLALAGPPAREDPA